MKIKSQVFNDSAPMLYLLVSLRIRRRTHVIGNPFKNLMHLTFFAKNLIFRLLDFEKIITFIITNVILKHIYRINLI